MATRDDHALNTVSARLMMNVIEGVNLDNVCADNVSVGCFFVVRVCWCKCIYFG